MAEQKDILDAITEFNRSYLATSQRMLRIDLEQGKRLLGISDEMAAHIVALTPAQIGELAKRTELICEFRSEIAPGRA